MMKRALVFGFLGPVLSGWVLVIASFLLNRGSVDYVLVIPYMIVEIIPLLLCGLADLLLEKIPVGERLLVLAVAGLLLSCAAMFALAPKAVEDFAFVFALSGALPAVGCSLALHHEQAWSRRG